MINYRSIDDLNRTIKEKLHLIPDVDCIVGIPRSGMLAASLIALYTGKPLASIEQVGKYASNQFTNRISLSTGIKTALVVDDSCSSGNAMNKVKEFLAPYDNVKFIYCAVYVLESSKNKVDFYFEICEHLRLFEWNIMDHSILSRSCVDFDGVLCVDPLPAQNDDGEKYLQFLRTAQPKFIPHHKIYKIVTCRLEKYRAETEQWLKEHNVQYEQLHMMNLPDRITRQRLGNYAGYKSEIYMQSGAALFIESNTKEASDIHNITNKPVYCVGDNKFYKEK